MRRKIIAVLTLVLLTLTACTGLPQDGPVNVVSRAPQAGGGVVLDPKGPVSGASPEEVVSSFLRATSAGYADDFAVALQHLTPEAGKSWNPTAQIRIYPDSFDHSLSQTRSGSIKVSSRALATVDPAGRFTEAAPDSILTTEFSLVRNEDNEWRIAVLEDGIILSDYVFQTSFAETPLYFVNGDETTLVPDVRWYPRERVIEQVPEGLVAGPPSWLAGAAHTAVPVDAQYLSVAQGNAEDNGVTVDLSADVMTLSDAQLRLLNTQFRQTFEATGRAQAVTITSEGAELPTVSQLDLSSYPFEKGDLLALQHGLPIRIGESSEVLISGDPITKLELTRLASGYAKELSAIVGLGSKDTAVYRLDLADGSATTLLKGKKLAPPSVDRYDWVWSGEVASKGKLLLGHEPTGEQATLDVPWLADAKIRSVAVSREGARLAVIYEKGDTTTLTLAGIERDEHGQPVDIGDPYRVGQQLAEVHEIAWVDESRIATVGRTAGGAERGLFIVGIGAPMQTLTSRESIVDLTAGKGLESIVLQDSTGVLYEYDAGAWRTVTSNAVSPTLPG